MLADLSVNYVERQVLLSGRTAVHVPVSNLLNCASIRTFAGYRDAVLAKIGEANRRAR